jgi:amino acid transporter
LLGSLGFGIAACIWLYAGYESLGTVAGEIKRPHLIPRAILLSIPVIIALYAIPTMASIAAVGDWQNWATEGAGKISFVSIANYLQMPMLLLPFGIAAVASCSSLYSTYMASGTRGFYVLAEDKLCPKFFKDIHPKYGTPYKAILSMAVVNLVLCWFDFEVLVVIDVFFIMFAYIMIYIAAIILRIKEPGLPRPYRLPFGVKGLTAFCVPPTLLALMAIFYNGFGLFVAGCLGAISGPIAYYIFKRRYGGLDGAKVVSKKNIKNSLVFSSVMLAAIAIACLIQFIIHNS